MKSSGEILKELSGDINISTVAASTGVMTQAIWNYENDIRVPRDDVKQKLADYYKTSVEMIF